MILLSNFEIPKPQKISKFVFKKSQRVDAKYSARTWKCHASKVWLILNMFCFESMPISLKTTKIFTVKITSKKWEMMFFGNLKKFMSYIAREIAHAHLKMLWIESVTDFEHFVLKVCPYFLKQKSYSQS